MFPQQDGEEHTPGATTDTSQVTRVIYVVFSAADEDVYRRLAPEYFPRVAV